MNSAFRTPGLPACLLLMLIAWPHALALAANLPDDLPESELAILSADGQRHDFTVLLATKPAELARGLMFVTEMDEQQGMLFDFGETRPVSMWMRNTALPLDMLFIRADGTISEIAAQTVPYTRTSIVSKDPVRFVLEVLGGTSKRLGIAAGDRVQHSSISSVDVAAEDTR